MHGEDTEGCVNLAPPHFPLQCPSSSLSPNFIVKMHLRHPSWGGEGEQYRVRRTCLTKRGDILCIDCLPLPLENLSLTHNIFTHVHQQLDTMNRRGMCFNPIKQGPLFLEGRWTRTGKILPFRKWCLRSKLALQSHPAGQIWLVLWHCNVATRSPTGLITEPIRTTVP